MNEFDSGGINREVMGTRRGHLARYKSLVTTQPGWVPFFRYELSTFMLKTIPGSVGIALRRCFYRRLFKRMGRKVVFGRQVLFRRPERISLGDHVSIGDQVLIDPKGNEAEIIIGNHVCIENGAILSCPGGTMRIENYTVIGPSCRLGSLKGLEVGEYVTMEPLSYLSGASHRSDDLEAPIIMQPVTSKGLTRIGNHVRIRTEATILDGLWIGDGAEIAPGSLVTKNVAPGARVEGVPAK